MTTPRKPPPAAPAASGRPIRTPKRSGAKVVLYTDSGWGKTTAASQLPNPFILMGPREKGYDRLLQQGRVAAVPAVDIETYPSFIGTLRDVANNPSGTEWVVLDALGAFDAMVHQYVTEKHFGGDVTDKGFLSFNKGYDLSAGLWMEALSAVDSLSMAGVNVLMLAHSRVDTAKNPEGTDFDKIVLDVHKKTVPHIMRSATDVLYGCFHVTVAKERMASKGKATMSRDRWVWTRPTGAYSAKQQTALPEFVVINEAPDGESPDFSPLWQYFKEKTNG